MKPRSFVAVVIALGLAATVLRARAADWPVFGHDPSRSGVDAGDTALTAANVSHLRAMWQIPFGTPADSAPIYLERVTVGRRAIPMLFLTNKSGVTFGIEARTGHIAWRFATHGPKITTSAPAADPSGTAVYVPGVDALLHKLDAATGHELRAPGFPVRVTLMPQTEKDASELNVANGYLYATTSGYDGDAPPYDGHVVAVRLSDGATHVFNSLCSRNKRLPTPTSCSNSDSGIWSRGGAVVDPDPSMHGAIYAATGNGLFDATAGGDNYGDSVVSLTADASHFLGNYTPADYTALQDGDTDMGSTSPAMIPRQPASRTPLMLVEGGKDGTLRLVDRAPLPGVADELSEMQMPAALFSTPAVWSEGARTTIVIGLQSAVQAYGVATDASGRSRLVLLWSVHPGSTGGEGTSPVVSNGIVFVAFDGALVALDVHNGRTLWSSAQPSAMRTIGGVHWESPIVADGRVYCPDENGRLTAYELR
ncbi:MAG: PQQ-binding-like beta-propeller repeat protein [Candidatus Eremiobacteraeota bacterium]|nr:PQQ-binding-like beta-propeller repeat protein [Candidatus Eremiobacteraeota bacterium]MBV8284931.1 PQQ-binding-like beta-propeller repeat protein [Candidatus Eremiobacteraeota bacterium]